MRVGNSAVTLDDPGLADVHTLRVDERSVADYVARARRSPRLNEMSGSFSNIACGTEGAPRTSVSIDPKLLGNDHAALSYSFFRRNYAGPFNAHFVASVPYALEEQCRLGAALLECCLGASETASVYTLGDGAGVTARALASAPGGRVRTLNCSPTPENYEAFQANRPEGAHFFTGPFFDLTEERRDAIGGGVFRDGFDVIIEDTTFQMYGKERVVPMALALRHLKEDGLFVLIEKLAQPDPDEFMRRERQKDADFKSRFFSPDDIADKRNAIVSQMDSQLVTLEELADAVSGFFRNVIVTWNSGNFYTLAASNSELRLHRFAEALTAPAIPPEFLYEDLPLVLCAPASSRHPHRPYRFRQAKRSGM